MVWHLEGLIEGVAGTKVPALIERSSPFLNLSKTAEVLPELKFRPSLSVPKAVKNPSINPHVLPELKFRPSLSAGSDAETVPDRQRVAGTKVPALIERPGRAVR